MRIRQVLRLSDPVLPAVIELYQTAFRVREQMFASFFWRLFEANNPHQLIVAEQERRFLGFAIWEAGAPGEPGYLWYIAVRPEERGQGVGEELYRYVTNDLRGRGAPALMFEVELPEEVRGHAGPHAEQTARKRIDWYRRLGAHSLQGVAFDCSTDWHAPVLMLPMLHPFVPGITAQQAYQWGIGTLADGDAATFQQTGTLSLV